MKKFWVILLCLMSISAEARMRLKFGQEGGSHTGGGGGGVICKEGDSEQIMTLDFYEAFIKYGVHEQTAQDPYETNQVQKSDSGKFAKMSEEDAFFKAVGFILMPLPELQEVIFKYLRKVGNWNEWQDAELEEYNDSGRKYILKNGCKYVQLAVRDGNNIRANLKIIQRMEPAQRAALMLHEAIYFAAKTSFSGLKDSVVVRDIIARILTMLSMSEFDVSKAFDLDKLNDTEQLSLSTIDYYNHFELLELCRVAETVNLCHVNVRNKNELDNIRYDRFFEGYYDDQIESLERALKKLSKPSRSIQVIYSSLSKANQAYEQYRKDLSFSRSRVLTLPSILDKLQEKVAILQGMQCDVHEYLDVFLGEESEKKIDSINPSLMRVCRVTKTAILAVLDRMQRGYKRQFCYRVENRKMICSKAIDVPAVDLKNREVTLFDVDLMDIRMRLEIEQDLKKLYLN